MNQRLDYSESLLLIHSKLREINEAMLQRDYEKALDAVTDLCSEGRRLRYSVQELTYAN